MMIKQVVIGLFILGLLQGCSISNARQSLIVNGDWYQLGVNKGRWGEKAAAEEHLLEDAKIVGEGISVDYQTYLQGYQKGLESYCTLEQVKQFGMEGKMEWGVCEFRRDEDGLYNIFWQQGFERYVSFDGVGGH